VGLRDCAMEFSYQNRNHSSSLLRNSLLILVSVLIFDQCALKSEKTIEFDEDLDLKKSVVVLTNGMAESATDCSGSVLTQWPLEYLDAESAYESGKVYLTYKIRRPAYGRISWNQLRQRLFLIPGDTLIIDGEDDDELDFKGRSASMNKYLYWKSKELNMIDPVSAKGSTTSLATSLEELVERVDSITQLELAFLKRAASEQDLPDWFTRLEQSEIEYFGATLKLGAPKYRKELLDMEEDIPTGYYDFMDQLSVNEPHAQLSVYYFEYLTRLAAHFWELKGYGLQKQDENVASPGQYEFAFDFYDSQLDQPLRDLAYSYSLSKVIVNKFSVDPSIVSEAIDRIQSVNLRELISKIRAEQLENQLAPGEQAPSFELPNSTGDTIDLAIFKGKVVLISFWATWCKPCFEEFPYEDELVEALDGRDFELVSICMGSSEANWRTVLDREQPKTVNLYANKEWQRQLRKQYRVSALPHFTLIDKRGQVIQNNTSRPSDSELKRMVVARLTD